MGYHSYKGVPLAGLTSEELIALAKSESNIHLTPQDAQDLRDAIAGHGISWQRRCIWCYVSGRGFYPGDPNRPKFITVKSKSVYGTSRFICGEYQLDPITRRWTFLMDDGCTYYRREDAVQAARKRAQQQGGVYLEYIDLKRKLTVTEFAQVVGLAVARG